MRIRAVALTALGLLFLGLGAIGLLLPVWPTTPFVLLSATCLSATPRLRAQIMRITFFREYATHYADKTGISRKTVVLSLVWLWGMLLLSMALVHTLWIVLVLLPVGALVTWHIVWIARKYR